MAMETSLKLSDIFNNRILRIPDYQRGYAWGEKQLKEFWEDLEDLRPGNRHYTGSIFVEESTKIDAQDEWIVNAGYSKCDVVDGQQRLTTIVILLNELITKLKDDQGYNELGKLKLQEQYLFRDSLSKNSRSYIFNYASDDPNYSFISNNIYNDTKQIDKKNYNAYAQNLLFAKHYFQQQIEMLPHQECELVFSKVTKSLAFDLRKIDPCLKVEAVFEVMNNRGKKLTILERLKNRLVYLTGYIEADENDRRILRIQINDAWKVIYQFLAKNPDNILDEDDFFISHLSMYTEPKESVFSYETAEDKIFKMFSTRSERFGEEKVSFNSICNYLLSISKAIPVWYEIHNTEDELVKKILILSSFRDVKIFLLSLFRTCEDCNQRQVILSKLENLLFRNRVPGLWTFDERSLSTAARDLYAEEKNVDDVDTYLDNIQNTTIDKQSFIRDVHNLFTYQRGNFGFHRWGSLKYFLYEYDDYLKHQFREQDKKLFYNSYDDNTIEHILPRNWSANWSNFFNEALLQPQNDTDRIVCNSLGNLTILRGGKNSSLGDASWGTKKNRYRTGSYNEIEISQVDQWSIQSIAERGLKLLAFLESKISGLNLTDDEKIDILFYREDIISSVKHTLDK